MHLPLTANPRLGAILPWISGIVLSNVITRLTTHKLTIKKLVGMCMRLFFFIIVITMVLQMIERKIMRKKEDAWINFSVFVNRRKLHEEAGRATVVIFKLVVLFVMVFHQKRVTFTAKKKKSEASKLLFYWKVLIKKFIQRKYYEIVWNTLRQCLWSKDLCMK